MLAHSQFHHVLFSTTVLTVVASGSLGVGTAGYTTEVGPRFVVIRLQLIFHHRDYI